MHDREGSTERENSFESRSQNNFYNLQLSQGMSKPRSLNRYQKILSIDPNSFVAQNLPLD